MLTKEVFTTERQGTIWTRVPIHAFAYNLKTLNKNIKIIVAKQKHIIIDTENNKHNRQELNLLPPITQVIMIIMQLQ